MSFRWKILLLFLAFSLVPIIVVSLINQTVTERTGAVVSQGAAEAMENVVRDDIIQLAGDISEDVARSRNTLLFTVGVLAEKAQQNLADPPARTSEEVYSLRDFRSPTRAPDDVTELPAYAPPGRDSAAVSIDYPVLFFADGRTIRQSDGVYPADVRSLVATAPLMRRIFQSFQDVIFRVYLSLESGLHCSLPGHGEYPQLYDPRERAWYRRAVEADKPVWTLPLQDAPTNRLILTASAPIRDAAGRTIGVAGLDVLDSVAMGGQQITDRWGSSARAFLVYPMPNPDTGAMGLRVAASRPPQAISPPDDSHAERAPSMHHPWLEGLAAEDTAALLENLGTKVPGAMEVTFDGSDYLLAYSSLDTVHFLIMVPQSSYMTLPNRVQRAINGIMEFNLFVTGAATALVIAAVFALVFFGVRRYTRPLLQIADAARRLGEGDFSVHLDMRLKDERDQLVRSLNEMGPKLEDHLRLRHALAVAEEVQRNFLPKAAPQLRHFDIQGASIYCDETGGDYYDYIPFKQGDQTSTAVLVGDVSGHGVPSALLMATARALLRCLCAIPGQEMTLAQRVSLVNNLLCSDVAATGRFMTLFLLEIDESADLVRWVRAGHDPALLYDPAADAFKHLEGDGLVLGVLSDYEYRSYDAELATPGLVLAMGTDGIWEARNAAGDMFGKERFQKVIRDNADKDAASIFETVIDALVAFTDGVPFEDDVTLVIVKRK